MIDWEYLIARCLFIVIAATAFATLMGLQGCGGGGEDPPADKAGSVQQGEPPCKSIPVEQREATCGT